MNKESTAYIVNSCSDSFLRHNYYDGKVCKFSDDKDVLSAADLIGHSNVEITDPALQKQYDLSVLNLLKNLKSENQIISSQINNEELKAKLTQTASDIQQIAEHESEIVIRAALSELGLENVCQLDTETNSALKAIAKMAKSDFLSKKTKKVVQENVFITMPFDIFERFSQVAYIMKQFIIISQGGFFPTESSITTGKILWDALSCNKEVNFQYFFSPNYDPSSEYLISPNLSSYRIGRVENFVKIVNILKHSGLKCNFNFYYDDVPEHLELKSRNHYGDKANDLEFAIGRSFEELKEVIWLNFGDSANVSRVTKEYWFPDYYSKVDKNWESYVLTKHPLIEQIAIEDSSSVSRHRSGLDFNSSLYEVAKRIAQGQAGIEICKEVNPNSIIVTMETNRKELGLFINTAKPNILNLQKSIEG